MSGTFTATVVVVAAASFDESLPQADIANVIAKTVPTRRARIAMS
jgi:hypothetical protein